MKKMFPWELGETCEESDDNLKYEQLQRNFDDLHRNYQTLCKICLHRNKKSDDMECVIMKDCSRPRICMKDLNEITTKIFLTLTRTPSLPGT